MLPQLHRRAHSHLLAISRERPETGTNADDWRRAAHSLESTSATFGVVVLSAVARELECRARDGVLEAAAGLIARAEAELVEAKVALETVRKAP